MENDRRSRQDALVVIGALIAAFGVWTLAEKTGLLPQVVWRWWQTLWAGRKGLALIAVGVLVVIAASRGAKPHVPPAGTPLRRSRSDRWVAGVLGGLAQYFSVDPVLLRLAYLAFAVLGDTGTAVIAYVVMALVVPEEPADGSGAGGSA